jgi:hypothetical protein
MYVTYQANFSAIKTLFLDDLVCISFMLMSNIQRKYS